MEREGRRERGMQRDGEEGREREREREREGEESKEKLLIASKCFHRGTGYGSNFRPGVYYSSKLDQVDNPVMGYVNYRIKARHPYNIYHNTYVVTKYLTTIDSLSYLVGCMVAAINLHSMYKIIAIPFFDYTLFIAHYNDHPTSENRKCTLCRLHVVCILL